jgi:hypothetical protein
MSCTVHGPEGLADRSSLAMTCARSLVLLQVNLTCVAPNALAARFVGVAGAVWTGVKFATRFRVADAVNV